jgi:segregation and condensation protein B
MVERALAMAATTATVTSLSPEDRRRALRVIEAVIFAASEPVAVETLADKLPDQHDIEGLLRELQQAYAGRGVNLVQVAGKWAFRTADDLSFLLSRDVTEPKRLSRAALETLAIVAYHQPVTRAEIEEIRGVSASRGTLDVLLEVGWVRMRGRRRAPGRPITYGTTEAFLDHFGLNAVADLPGLDELKGAGLLDGASAALSIPDPRDPLELAVDEDPLADDDPGTDII